MGQTELGLQMGILAAVVYFIKSLGKRKKHSKPKFQKEKTFYSA